MRYCVAAVNRPVPVRRSARAGPAELGAPDGGPAGTARLSRLPSQRRCCGTVPAPRFSPGRPTGSRPRRDPAGRPQGGRRPAAADYARTERDPADSRKLNIVLTARGEAYAQAIVGVIDELNLELSQRVDPTQLAAADAILRAAIDRK